LTGTFDLPALKWEGLKCALPNVKPEVSRKEPLQVIDLLNKIGTLGISVVTADLATHWAHYVPRFNVGSAIFMSLCTIGVYVVASKLRHRFENRLVRNAKKAEQKNLVVA